MEIARIAGIVQASPAQKMKSATTPMRMKGFEPLLPATWISRLCKVTKTTSPAARPPTTVNPMLRETIQSTWMRCAPKAMRMPNSLVRCATE